jgi:hypothetical protein
LQLKELSFSKGKSHTALRSLIVRDANSPVLQDAATGRKETPHSRENKKKHIKGHIRDAVKARQ